MSSTQTQSIKSRTTQPTCNQSIDAMHPSYNNDPYQSSNDPNREANRVFFPSHLPLLKDAANEVPADRLCEKRSGLAPLGLRSATFGAFGELVWCSLVFRFGENKVWFVLI